MDFYLGRISQSTIAKMQSARYKRNEGGKPFLHHEDHLDLRPRKKAWRMPTSLEPALN